MNGTVSLGGAAQRSWSLPKVPQFNAGEYLSKAISDLKAKSDQAYVMSQNKNAQSNDVKASSNEKIEYRVSNAAGT